jgi:acyl-CoA synthetase (AMP-forming)/AMP-acid ligase II
VNLALSLLYAAERNPEAEAVVQGSTRLTYSALRERAARLAGGLAAEGVGPCDRLAAIVRPRHESVQLYWACQWLGATFVPLSPRVSAADIAYCREDSGARLFLEADVELGLLLGEEHPGALDLPDDHESLMLYTNARLRLGESGEVLCHMSSEEAFTGYWNRPDADAKAIDEDGWYHTGDVGRLDEDGDLWLDGRLDDMIISGGENVHPLEVEDVLANHPGVREVAVVGATDERLGQRVVAYVVAEGDVAAEQLDEHCLASDTLARFKRPREYRFVDELPKSPSGKILRRMLREEEVTA